MQLSHRRAEERAEDHMNFPLAPKRLFLVVLVFSLFLGGDLGKSGEVLPNQTRAGLHIDSVGNVTVLAGQSGELKCRVTNLGNYTVLWIRHRDTHLLSAGSETYTADQRFRPYQGPVNVWGLRISSTRLTDGGVYECQISITPPISAFTYLTVVEPVTHIEGVAGRGSELFIKAGSTINLTCVVEDATENAPKHILWRHNSRIVNFEWARGGMSLVTEKKSKGVTVSRLLIQKAVRSDSGVYQCAPQNAHPAAVKIHVLEQGEKQAAMQSGGRTVEIRSHSLHILLPIALLSRLYTPHLFRSHFLQFVGILLVLLLLKTLNRSLDPPIRNFHFS